KLPFGVRLRRRLPAAAPGLTRLRLRSTLLPFALPLPRARFTRRGTAFAGRAFRGPTLPRGGLARALLLGLTGIGLGRPELPLDARDRLAVEHAHMVLHVVPQRIQVIQHLLAVDAQVARQLIHS